MADQMSRVEPLVRARNEGEITGRIDGALWVLEQCVAEHAPRLKIVAELVRRYGPRRVSLAIGSRASLMSVWDALERADA